MAEIKKILIANRGEIVQRAIRTIKELGKKSVAVYSAGDKHASYLKHADEAVCIGPAKSSESYLNIPAIIAAAEMTGCDAIFPGYGFLSENQDFVEICKLHNIKFIGPSVEVMDMMADKSKAKEVMVKAGIPVVPGSTGAVHTVEDGLKIAKEIGYPVMAKASAGGGGRGMRLVEREEDFANLFTAASSEALAASLFVLGFKEQGLELLDKFKWGHTFYELNQNLLDEYSKLENEGQIESILKDFRLL